MSGFILGKKTEVSQMFDKEGKIMPVTEVLTSPCHVVKIMWPQEQGYTAVQLGFAKAKNIAKPVKGQLDKAGIKTPLRFLREFRVDTEDKNIKVVETDGKKTLQIGEVMITPGMELTPEMLFKEGDIVNVSGTSKGKGFQGVVRRHGFAGGPKTHGQSDRERAPGSIGSGTTPGRVYKGMRMAGRMGGVRQTIKNLKVIKVEGDKIYIKGLVPGHKDNLLEVAVVQTAKAN